MPIARTGFLTWDDRNRWSSWSCVEVYFLVLKNSVMVIFLGVFPSNWESQPAWLKGVHTRRSRKFYSWTKHYIAHSSRSIKPMSYKAPGCDQRHQPRSSQVAVPYKRPLPFLIDPLLPAIYMTTYISSFCELPTGTGFYCPPQWYIELRSTISAMKIVEFSESCHTSRTTFSRNWAGSFQIRSVLLFEYR